MFGVYVRMYCACVLATASLCMSQSTCNQVKVEQGDFEQGSYLKFGRYRNFFKAGDLGATGAHIANLLMECVQWFILDGRFIGKYIVRLIRHELDTRCREAPLVARS